MNRKLRGYQIRIPKNLFVTFAKNNNLLTFIGPKSTKSLRLKLRVELVESEKLIKVSDTPFSAISNKKIKVIRGTTVAIIKQLIVEVSTSLYQKLKITGIGYRALSVGNIENLLQLKLGFSHPIFFKIPNNLKLYNLKSNRLCLYANSFTTVTSITAQIRELKTPDPYKGKGISYEKEKLVIKEGKKS